MIQKLIDAHDFKGAMDAIDASLSVDPEDSEALYFFGVLMLESDHPGPARVVMEKLSRDYPSSVSAWLGLGRAWDDLGRIDKSRTAIKRAYRLDKDNPRTLTALSCVASKSHKWEEAISWADKALAHGDDLQAKINKAFGLLYKGEFGEGWDLYAEGVGHMVWRDMRQYRDLPHWTGDPTARVIWYAEQGLGDQIAFLSALKDAAAINCNPKLVTLFSESFGFPTFGDQFVDEPEWIESVNATHIAPFSWLHKHYRRTRESYTGEPFLTANPDKVTMWRGLLETLPRKPNIGIAWTGGTKGSFEWQSRSKKLTDFLPLFDSVDANWIDLEYKDRTDEISELWATHGHRVHSWSWGSRSKDYSDTAALVANLDAVVCVPTAIYHLAGGLGIPAYVLCPQNVHFHEAGEGEWCRYYRSVRLLRGQFSEKLKTIGEAIEAPDHNPGRTGARDDEVPGDEFRSDRDERGGRAVYGGALPAH